MPEDQRIQAEAVERVRYAASEETGYEMYSAGSIASGIAVRAADLRLVLANLDKLATENAIRKADGAGLCERLNEATAARDRATARAESAEASTTSLLEEVERWRAIHDEDMTAHRALSVKLAGLEGAVQATLDYPCATTVRALRQALSDLPPSPGVESVLAAADANREGVETAARFLLDRLNDYENTEEAGREFHGHVLPAMCRLKQSLATLSPSRSPVGGEALARQFHEAYERLAPQFGYETRADTKQFDPTSPNGKLMIAVCETLSPAPAQGDVAGLVEAADIRHGAPALFMVLRGAVRRFLEAQHASHDSLDAPLKFGINFGAINDLQRVYADTNIPAAKWDEFDAALGLLEKLDKAVLGLNPLTGYGEDSVWRPADRARSALIEARDILSALSSTRGVGIEEAAADDNLKGAE